MKKAGRPQNLELDRIRVDGDTQVRSRIDQETVAAYADRMQAGDKFPAIVVFRDGSDHWLSDGFHRMLAARRLERRTIPAQVRKGSREDAAWYACGANRANGLRMTNADKERAVKLALAMRPGESNRAIANHVGVNDKTVAKYRPTAEIPQSETRTGRDGRTINTTNIGRRPTPDDPPPVVDGPPSVTDNPPTAGGEPPTADRQPPPSANDLPPEVPYEPPPAAAGDSPPAVPDVETDRLGQVFPNEQIAEVFRRDHELVELCTAISRIKKTILDMLAQQDPLVRYVNPGSFEADANNLRRHIDAARPYAVCPYCGGEGCRVCGPGGWVNKQQWDFAPNENKAAMAAPTVGSQTK